MKTVRIILDFYHPWPNNAPFFVARAKGLFEAVGIDLELACADPFRGDALDYLTREEGEFGISYPNRLMARRAQGVNLWAISALNEQPMESFVLPESKGLRDLSDLKGLRIGFRRSPRLAALLGWMLGEAGLNINHVEPIELYPEEPTPVTIYEGRIDVAFGALGVWEGLITSALDPERYVSYEINSFGAPPYNAQVLVTRPNVSDEIVSSVTRCLAEGAVIAREDLEFAASVMHEAAPFYPLSMHRQSLARVSENWNLPHRWGHFNYHALATYQDWLLDHQLIATSVDIHRTFHQFPEVPAR
ncbi:MAG: ABC transporter substrate-binding protein [Fimbriimonadaceae bacterium]|jgi:NitT/TauT family transport system substrate-binding protein|nr:ABC transporter substrate-binding protein [Fimbriimonadaceae bacterium]